MTKKRGFTMIEILTAAGVTLLVGILIAQTSVMSASTFDKLGKTGTSFHQSRISFERMVQDVQNADMTLAKYPTTGTPVYVAADNQTLILRQPCFDTAKEPIANKYRVLIFKVEAASVTADGPNVLKRYVATVNGTTQNAAVFDRVVAKNIATMTMTIAGNQIFWGNNSTKAFYLSSAPLPATDQVKTEILVGGTNRLEDGYATLVTNKVTFTKAPANGVIVDASYHVDPDNSVNSTGDNGGTSVYLECLLRPQWKSVGHSNKTRDITMTSRPTLLNKAD